MKLGRNPTRHDPRTLRLSKYLAPDLPPAPAAMDWQSKIVDWGMMENDTIGDCTCAAAGHYVQVIHAATGPVYTPPNEAIVGAYSALSGYDPKTGANDNGCVELDVLNYLRKYGLSGEELIAYAAVDPKNHEHVRQAILRFGAVYIGLALPISADDQISHHRIWDLTTGPNAEPWSWGGHAVICAGYDEKEIRCVTWGVLQPMTWRFWDAYCEECYVLLWKTWLERATPDFNLPNLQTDLVAISK